MGKIIDSFSQSVIGEIEVNLCVDDLTQQIGVPCLVGSKGSVYHMNGTRDRAICIEFPDIKFGRIWKDFPASHHIT